MKDKINLKLLKGRHLIRVWLYFIISHHKYKRKMILYYAAAAATVIAGILHLILDLTHFGSNILGDTFFIVAGISQIFWALPMTKRWGIIWYYIGIGGTLVLIILWVVTRVPNQITGGKAFPIEEWGIAISIFQIVYIVITALIIAKERSERVPMIKEKR
jgi:hypothetical protein